MIHCGYPGNVEEVKQIYRLALKWVCENRDVNPSRYIPQRHKLTVNRFHFPVEFMSKSWPNYNI